MAVTLSTLLTTLTRAAFTWVVTGLLTAVTITGGSPNWYSTKELFVICGGTGSADIVTWKVTVTSPPGGRTSLGGPAGILNPAAGSSPACGTPLIVTLPGTKAVPAGGTSKKNILLASTLP